MGYKITLSKDKSFLGIEIIDAYHSIETVTLKDGKVAITVCVYPTREAKYTKGLRKNTVLAPVYQTVDPLDESISSEPDIASFTTVEYQPAVKIVNPKLGSYYLTINAMALFPSGIPFDIQSQKDSLYPVIKRLLGHEGAEDVFEEVEEDVAEIDM